MDALKKALDLTRTGKIKKKDYYTCPFNLLIPFHTSFYKATFEPAKGFSGVETFITFSYKDFLDKLLLETFNLMEDAGMIPVMRGDLPDFNPYKSDAGDSYPYNKFKLTKEYKNNKTKEIKITYIYKNPEQNAIKTIETVIGVSDNPEEKRRKLDVLNDKMKEFKAKKIPCFVHPHHYTVKKGKDRVILLTTFKIYYAGRRQEKGNKNIPRDIINIY